MVLNYSINVCSTPGACLNQAQPSDFASSQVLIGSLLFVPGQAFSVLQVSLAASDVPSDFKDFSISLTLASPYTVGKVNASSSSSHIRISASSDARGLPILFERSFHSYRTVSGIIELDPSYSSQYVLAGASACLLYTSPSPRD